MKHLSHHRKRFATVMIIVIVFVLLFSTIATVVMYLGSGGEVQQREEAVPYGSGSQTGSVVDTGMAQ